MKETSGYNTTARKEILNFLVSNINRTVTVNDIEKHLIGKDMKVNLSTIYRYLNKLSSEGRVLKYVEDKGDMAGFQYVEKEHQCHNHLHIKCKNCGKIIHLDCEFMDEITEHILNHHGFELQCDNSILYGLCKECREVKGK